MTYLIGTIAVASIAILYYFVGRKAGREECSKAISGLNIFEDDWVDDGINYKKFKKSHR